VFVTLWLMLQSPDYCTCMQTGSMLVLVCCRLSVDNVYHVFVCDIGKPWAVHRVASFAERIVSLQWHSSGLKMLIATVHGNCYVYQMKVYSFCSLIKNLS